MSEPIVVPHPFLTVVGGLTPDMLTELPEGKGRDDGFMARLLFAYPDREAIATRIGESRRRGRRMGRMARSLWDRAMRADGRQSGPPCRQVGLQGRRAHGRSGVNAHRAEQDADDFPDAWRDHGASWKPTPPGWR